MELLQISSSCHPMPGTGFAGDSMLAPPLAAVAGQRPEPHPRYKNLPRKTIHGHEWLDYDTFHKSKPFVKQLHNQKKRKQNEYPSLDYSPIRCSHPVPIFNRSLWYHIRQNNGFFAPSEVLYIIQNNDEKQGTMHDIVCRAESVGDTHFVSLDALASFGDFQKADTIYHPPFNTFNHLAHLVANHPLYAKLIREIYILLDSVKIPLFNFVPCGHCDLCRDAKSRDWAIRCNYECQDHEKLPLFVTLTYAPEHLPYDGNDPKEFQDFMKRFRINIQRKLHLSKEQMQHIRFVACSEYGTKKTRRPHIHVLLWGLPDKFYQRKSQLEIACQMQNSKNNKNYKVYPFKVSRFGDKLLRHSWGNGRVFAECCFNAKCSDYVVKYMRKTNNIPDGKNPNFFRSSRRLGAIGYPFFKRVVQPYIYEQPTSPTFSYYDSFEFKPRNAVIPLSFYKKVFPTASDLIPKEFRYKLIALHYYHKLLSLYDTGKDLLSFFDLTLSPRLEKLIGLSTKYCRYHLDNLRKSVVFDSPLFESSGLCSSRIKSRLDTRVHAQNQYLKLLNYFANGLSETEQGYISADFANYCDLINSKKLQFKSRTSNKSTLYHIPSEEISLAKRLSRLYETEKL